METRVAGKLLAVQASLSVLSIAWQLAAAVLCILICFWISSLLLEPFVLVGISTVPPGLAHVDDPYRRH